MTRNDLWPNAARGMSVGCITAHLNQETLAMLLEGLTECTSIKGARHRGSSGYGHAVQLGQANGLETLEPSFNSFPLFFVATLEDFSLQDLLNLGVHYKTLCQQSLANPSPALRWLDYGRMFKMLLWPWF